MPIIRTIMLGLIALACIALSIETNAGEVLDRIRKSGVLRSPVPDVWPPYVIERDDGNLDGFDVEVLREIVNRIGVELKYVTNSDGTIITWNEQTSGDWQNKYDIVVNSMTPTAKRAENLLFPVNYYYGLGVLAVHRDNSTIRTPADASNKRIGALKSAIYELYLRREPLGVVGAPPVTYKIDNPTIVTYDHEEQVFDALAKGDGVELDGFVNFLPVVMSLIKEGRPFKIVGQPLFRFPLSVAIQPGDAEFAELLKTTVEQMRGDGTLTRLSMKWFDFDITKP